MLRGDVKRIDGALPMMCQSNWERGRQRDGLLKNSAPRFLPTGGRILLFALFAGIATCATAELPSSLDPPNDAEMRLLPAYCPDTQGFTRYGYKKSPNSQKWEALMGQTFWALHHYCWGILKLNRSTMNGYPPEIRQGLRRSALGEFAFVTRLLPDHYVLAPEIYTYVGRAHLLLNEPLEANAAFATARKLKPDYWPAYSWWANYLVDRGQREAARAIVAEGLQHAPNSKSLQLIMRELGSEKGGPATNNNSAQR